MYCFVQRHDLQQLLQKNRGWKSTISITGNRTCSKRTQVDQRQVSDRWKKNELSGETPSEWVWCICIFIRYELSIYLSILPSLKRSMLHFFLVVVVEQYLLVPKVLQIFNARGDSLPFFKLNDRSKNWKTKLQNLYV